MLRRELKMREGEGMEDKDKEKPEDTMLKEVLEKN